MEKALAIDPEFAMAYRSMAMSYKNLGYYSEEKKCLQKALELSNRISERERYLIQGNFYAFSEKTYDKAIEAYNKLLSLYSEESTWDSSLGMIYWILEEWDKALEKYERARRAEPKNYLNNMGLAAIYFSMGLYNKGKEILESYVKNVSDTAYFRDGIALCYFFQNKQDLAQVELDKAFKLAPGFYINFIEKGDISFFKGDMIEAENQYQKLMEIEGPEAQLSRRGRLSALYLARGKFEESKNKAKSGIELAEKFGQEGQNCSFHLSLGYLYLKSGKLEEALKEYNKAEDISVKIEDLSYQRLALYNKGVAFLEMKSINEARKAASELKTLTENSMNKKAKRYYFYLQGLIEFETKNIPKAINYFKDAIALLSSEWANFGEHALFRNSLAAAYYQARDLKRAQKEYEKIISLTYGRLEVGDIYAQSFYMLGKIFEQQGQKAKARENYQHFLDLWKDADPGLPEIPNAKSRLSSL